MCKFEKEQTRRNGSGETRSFGTWIKRTKDNLLVHPLRFSGGYDEGLSLIRNLPRVPDGCGYLYIIQLGSQRVKVGKTRNPYSRLKAHQDNYEVYTGGSFDFISILGPFDNINESEDMLIDYVLSLGGENYFGREWFKFPDHIHIFDFSFKPTSKSFMFHWVHEVFEEFLKDIVAQYYRDRKELNLI